ncbi:MAG TPA: hypothetical protein ENH10_01810 [Bacteroidetes bacterium]|nr:hypothetical protein BMS3Bbin04_00510 [bacterium BMS3Bbin04]HDO64753.1 hypothetical protein [Bacteroidota bacterium]HEX03878.1 hypothetical protein [Bacteroidota bacterium]
MVNTELKKDRKGSVILYSVILMLILVVTGGAFMKWAADEAYQARYDLARSQAHYIAQKGAIERGMALLRSKKITELTAASEALPDGRRQKYGDFIGYYNEARISQESTLYNLEESEFVKTGAWDASSVGIVEYTTPNGTPVQVKSRCTLRSQMRTFANYMYLTDIETVDIPGGGGDEVIWFFTGDTLYGRVHSNDYIGIKQRPVFYGPVSTCKDEFRENAANAYFEFDPQFEVPEVFFPETAEDIRAGAQLYMTDEDGLLLHQIEGNAGSWVWYEWAAGNGTEPTLENILAQDVFPYSANSIAFFEGVLYIKGDYVQGKSTIACGGNMYLVDNIKYADVPSGIPTIPEDSPNILGLISEGNIVIRDSDANGKGNGGPNGADSPHNRAHIVITAGMVALGQSFTFEHQNDQEGGGNSCQNEPLMASWDHGVYNYGQQDLRGYIYVRGAIAQKRRGYVRRSNCGGTGYDKSYDYDFRLQTNPPPLYLAAQDADGNVFFEVTSSWSEMVVD